MSFWEDASPVVKGAILFGVVAIVVLAAVRFMGGDDGTTQERAVTAGAPR